MVGDLLDHQQQQQRSPSSELIHHHDSAQIQVTGKVALQNSNPSGSSPAVATSVIRRSPDSPDSSNEDSSAWFLRQVLQQQQKRSGSSNGADEDSAPLTPATSPARGVRRPRHPSSSSRSSGSGSEGGAEEEELEELDLKKESAGSPAPAEDEEKKRARVETIISTMRTSTPAATATSTSSGSVINGCKKRKLYQPQQHGKFTSEGEEEEEGDETPDERNDSLSEEQQHGLLSLARAQSAASRSGSVHHHQSGAMHQHDPIRSLQERIASLHQQRFAALQQNKPAEQQQQQVRRPVRDDAGRTRNPLQQQQHFGMRPSLPSDLSHVSQAHAAYIDATRRLLMEQQQRQQQMPGTRPAQPAQPAQQPQPQPQQREKESINELEGLAEMLKSELASSLAQLVDNTLSRFTAQRKAAIVNNNKLSAAEQESELSKLQRGRVIDRGLRNGDLAALGLTSPFLRTPYAAAALQPHQLFPQQASPNAALNHIVNSIAGAGLHPAVAGLANSFVQQQQQSAAQQDEEADAAEQNEALSLVVSPKKRRLHHSSKSSERDGESPVPGNGETRLSPLEISLINSTAQSPPPSRTPTPPQQAQQQRSAAQQQPSGPPPPLLHHPNLFTNYSAYFAAAAAAAAAGVQQQRSKSPSELDLASPSTSSLLHPALLASHHHHQRHHHHSSSQHDNVDRHSESSDRTSPYNSGGIHQSSTLTPMHLRKAKLMFFWCRYPSSSVLKTFFPDVNFNKNNTAQLVKWFSNFREFYYIQMEKYSRQLLSEGVVNADDIHVSVDSELFRALNLHYNRNNHIEVPAPFVFVVSETLREFFKAIQAGKDAEPSWKKAIYKIIARLDEQVPEYFRTPNFLEHLE